MVQNKSLWEELQQLREEGAKAKERAEIRQAGTGRGPAPENRAGPSTCEGRHGFGDLAQAGCTTAEAKGAFGRSSANQGCGGRKLPRPRERARRRTPGCS